MQSSYICRICLTISNKHPIHIKFLVNANTIASIIGLPKFGSDPTPFFTRKEKDNNLFTRMKGKDGLVRDKRGFDIAYINDKDVRFVTKVYLSKLLRKMQPNQCTRGVTNTAK